MYKTFPEFIQFAIEAHKSLYAMDFQTGLVEGESEC